MIDILVPVMQRPQNAAPFMESLAATVVLDADVKVTVIPGPDPTVDEITAWVSAGARVTTCRRQPGSFPQKINHGYILTAEPWMLLVGDDVRFHAGWFEAAVRYMESSGCQVIGTNDLGNGAVTSGQHATHPIINREYVDNLGASWDGPGYVCHEGYRHCYVDDEIVHVAKQRGTWTSALDSIVEHMHPCWGKAEHDDVYAIGGASMAVDSQLFHHRRSIYIG